MKKIRRNIFETNSSSTHALIVCNKDVFTKFKNDKICMIVEGFGVDPFFVEKNKDNYLDSFKTVQEDRGYFVTWDFACEVYKNWVKTSYEDDISGYNRACRDMRVKEIDKLKPKDFKKLYKKALMYCFSYDDWKNGLNDLTLENSSFKDIDNNMVSLDSYLFLG